MYRKTYLTQIYTIKFPSHAPSIALRYRLAYSSSAFNLRFSINGTKLYVTAVIKRLYIDYSNKAVFPRVYNLQSDVTREL